MWRIVAVLCVLLLWTPDAIGQNQSRRSADDVSSLTLRDVADGAAKFKIPLLIAASGLVILMLWAGDTIKPGSLQRSGLRDVKPLPWAIWVFAAMIVMLSVPITAGAVRDLRPWEYPWLGAGGRVTGEVKETAIIMIGSYSVGIMVALGMVYIVAKSAPNAGLSLKAADFPIGLGLFILALPIVLLLGEGARAAHQGVTNSELPQTELAHSLLTLIVENRSNPWSWGLIATAVIGAPIVEEIAYRVFLQSGIFRATGKVWMGILLTSLLFAAVHMIGPNGVPWYAGVAIFALGLCCALAYERTRRLGVPIAMHMAFNALNIVLAFAATGGGR